MMGRCGAGCRSRGPVKTAEPRTADCRSNVRRTWEGLPVATPSIVPPHPDAQPVPAVFDVIVIGGGPAGLSASIYAVRKNLRVLLVTRDIGGQAAISGNIENYLGFPSGLSGAELTRRAITQTTRFGTEILTPKEVKNITVQDGYKITELEDGTIVHSKSIIIATGVAFTELGLEGIEKFTGAGVYYGSAAVEAHACRNEVIYIVGGGNSACQAAMYMSKFCKEVNILIRKDELKQTAAHYLVENISKTPNIKILPNTEVIALAGDEVLQEITLKNWRTCEEKKVPTKALFIYIGARPGTAWLNDIVLRNEKGFILTGSELVKEKSFGSIWKLNREPYLCEASVPGIFAAGDVRFGALTGISSAVGEGAMAVRFTRKYLMEI